MTRAQSAALVREWVSSETLRRHLLTVECALEAAALRAGLPPAAPPDRESVESWRCVGLLHDLDYERHPTQEEHPFKAVECLKARDVPAAWTDAILGHATYSGVPRVTPLAHTLFAVDELCGFLTAVARVRPSGKIAEVEVRSVRKKLKDKAFARGVSREDIDLGVTELGVTLDEHIAFVLQALQERAGRWESGLDL